MISFHRAHRLPRTCEKTAAWKNPGTLRGSFGNTFRANVRQPCSRVFSQSLTLTRAAPHVFTSRDREGAVGGGTRTTACLRARLVSACISRLVSAPRRFETPYGANCGSTYA